MLADLIAQVARKHPNDDPYDLAGPLVEKAKPEDILSLIANAIATAQRAVARDREAHAFNRAFKKKSRVLPAQAQGRPDQSPSAPPTPSVAAFRSLFNTKFAPARGDDKVTWGDATVDHHEKRIFLLETYRAGLARTADMHREAIRIIREAGVTCLADVEKKGVKAA